MINIALRKTQVSLDEENPDWVPWLEFLLRSLKRQKDHLAQKMEENKGWDGLPVDSVKILEYLQTKDRITISEVVIVTGTLKVTLKKQTETAS